MDYKEAKNKCLYILERLNRLNISPMPTKSLGDCMVYPASGLPYIEPPHLLANDLQAFYSMCGGLNLFEGTEYQISIVPPVDFVLANPVIVGELCEDDISSSWYIVGKDMKGNYLTIDLNQQRLGKCYESFFDTHGIAGSCPVIAISFTDLLTRLLAAQGGYWYWMDSAFEALGDAYD